MKSLVAKLLIVICLFSMTPMKEMVKIPMLYFHYLEHVKEMPELNFIGFLDMHYMHGIVLDEDFEKDMQLPFKALDFNLMPIFVVQENCKSDFTFLLSVFEDQSSISIDHDRYISEAKLKGIFHPPRVS